MVELKARSPGGGGSVFCPVARLERPGGGEESYVNPGAKSLFSNGGASDVLWEACPASQLASRDPEATLPGEGKKPPFPVIRGVVFAARNHADPIQQDRSSRSARVSAGD
jgi:hypothetical protein